MNDANLLARHAWRNLPRYTSYPTAADFTAAVGSAEHARWLARLDACEPISLYVHVPYCHDLCAYCGCHAKATKRRAPVEAYLETLLAEIGLVALCLSGRPPVARLSWGGGTPSILGIAGLERVLRKLGSVFDFRPGMEHAIELDPRHLDETLARGLVSIGVNRVSLGVQDIEPGVQEAIGRIQPVETVETAMGDLRAAGITRINCDLVYGLPHQTVDSVRRTCEIVAGLGPDRVAAYGYAHMPARRANQRLIDAGSLPGIGERFRLAQTVAATFDAKGYRPVGIDHYARLCDPLARAARAGRLRRNFQGYTDDDCRTLVGLGPSAISCMPDGFAQNESATGRWRARIEAGDLPVARGHASSAEDALRRGIIEALMCGFRADLGPAVPQFVDELVLLRPLVADGLVEIKGDVVTMTERGQPFVRAAAAVFDRFRTEAGGTFSTVV